MTSERTYKDLHELEHDISKTAGRIVKQRAKYNKEINGELIMLSQCIRRVLEIVNELRKENGSK